MAYRVPSGRKNGLTFYFSNPTLKRSYFLKNGRTFEKINWRSEILGSQAALLNPYIPFSQLPPSFLRSLYNSMAYYVYSRGSTFPLYVVRGDHSNKSRYDTWLAQCCRLPVSETFSNHAACSWSCVTQREDVHTHAHTHAHANNTHTHKQHTHTQLVN